MAVSNERRAKLERKLQSGNSVPVKDVRLDADELRSLLDMADERDRYRALLMAAASHMPPNKAETRGLRKRIDAALEGKHD